MLIGLLAPPLLWLACPAHVILRGLPPSARRWIVGKLKKSTWSGILIRRLTQPLLIWLLAFSVFLLWHEPVFANWLLGVSDKVGTPDRIAGNWPMDGDKATERWWFV